MKDYIIVEIIPNKIINGDIIQLQALKIKNQKIMDRMDYRLNYELINNPDLIDMISYDKDMFIYTKKKDLIINEFKKFVEDMDIFIIDNNYTRNYLKNIKNNLVSIFDYLDIPNNNESFNELIKKYQLENSNHLVDLLYEAITFHDA